MVYLDSVILMTVAVEEEEDAGEDVAAEDAAVEDAAVEETIGVMILATLVMKAMTYFLYYFFSPYSSLTSIKSL